MRRGSLFPSPFRLVNIFLFVALLLYANPNSSSWGPFVVLFVLLVPRIEVLAIANFVAGYFALSPIYFLGIFDAENSDLNLFRVAYLMFVALAGAFAWLTRKMNRNRLTELLVLLTLLLPILSFVSHPLTKYFMFVWAIGIWTFILFIRSLDSGQGLTWQSFGAGLLGPCAVSSIPVKIFKKEDIQVGRVAEKSICRLILIVFFLELLVKALKAQAISSVYIKMILAPGQGARVGLFENMNVPMTTREWWIVSVVVFIYGCLRVYLSLIAMIIFSWFLGAPIPQPLHHVMRRQSFFRFFKSVNYYYYRLIKEVFVAPMAARMRDPKIIRNCSGLLYFSGILFCGFLFHFLRRYEFLGREETFDQVGPFLAALNYWVFLGAFVGLSIHFQKASPTQTRAKGSFRWVLYCLVFVILFVFVREYEFLNIAFSERVGLFLRFFGVQL